MKKNLYTIIVVILLILILITEAKAAIIKNATTVEPFAISEAYIPSEKKDTVSYVVITKNEFVDTYDLETLYTLIELYEKQEKDICEQFPFVCEVTPQITSVLKQIEKDKNKYQRRVDRILYEQRMEEKKKEYPIATECWLMMKEQGWSNQICAGVLGNMMAECGGHTLDLKWNIGSDDYYGLCQWALEFSPNIKNASMQEQMGYLFSDIEKQFNYCGQNLNNFLKLTDVQIAALEFAMYYERCEESNYNVRMVDAITAYNYFME